MSTKTKPIKSAEELVAHMQEKGITFDIVSPEDAAKYMENNNNYFRVASYRKNYNKQLDSNQEPIDKYVNLDFGYLQDLAIIDMELRYTFLQLSLDIEHFTKMELLRQIEAHGEDGYQIVKDYMNFLSKDKRNHLTNELDQNAKSDYTGAIYDKYSPDYPVWVFLELVPFGTISHFYYFCADRFDDKAMKNTFYIMLRSKNVRNACAHNDCILNDLHTGTAPYKAKYLITQKLSKIHGLSHNIRSNRMSNERIQDLICVLYLHDTIVSSDGVHNKAAQKLHTFEDRMMRQPEYYKSNQLISSTFSFLKIVIDNWYPIS
jgi:abortive infection bacteriophage resistance protein